MAEYKPARTFVDADGTKHHFTSEDSEIVIQTDYVEAIDDVNKSMLLTKRTFSSGAAPKELASRLSARLSMPMRERVDGDDEEEEDLQIYHDEVEWLTKKASKEDVEDIRNEAIKAATRAGSKVKKRVSIDEDHVEVIHDAPTRSGSLLSRLSTLFQINDNDNDLEDIGCVNEPVAAKTQGMGFCQGGPPAPFCRLFFGGCFQPAVSKEEVLVDAGELLEEAEPVREAVYELPNILTDLDLAKAVDRMFETDDDECSFC